MLSRPAATAGVQLLHVDSGLSAHRTVATFVGEPLAILEAAYLLVEDAARLIDMTEHKGIHPRFGAVDVCPFVPLADATMDDCVQLAKQLGGRIGDELKLPVWLYGAAGSVDAHKQLRNVRRGGFEGLRSRFADGEVPDYGPPEVGRAGAVAIGARPLLIAFNIDLDSDDVSIANEIAKQVRTSGGQGKNAQDELTKLNVQLPACLAIGWYLPEYGQVQVSMNLTDFAVTPPHVAYAAVHSAAANLGVQITGCELVGLIPLRAILQAGEAFSGAEGQQTARSQADLIAAAAEGFGLDSHGAFIPEERIIELALERHGISLCVL